MQEADRAGGRRNISIMLGLKRPFRIYSLVIVLTYVLLLVLVIAGILPVSALAFKTLPIGIRAITLVLRDYENDQELMKALGLNVIIVLAVPFLVSSETVIGSF